MDFHELNQRTVKDSHALPRLQEITDNLKGAKYFLTLDMRSGFYQVEIEEDHKPFTAFSAGPLVVLSSKEWLLGFVIARSCSRD